MDSPYTEDKFVIHYKNYVKPKDLEEAFALNAGKSAVIAGGFCFLRLQQKNIGTLLDLKELLSDQIEAVSYTHLDVYKRQKRRFLPFLCIICCSLAGG